MESTSLPSSSVDVSDAPQPSLASSSDGPFPPNPLLPPMEEQPPPPEGGVKPEDMEEVD
mgnify:CR=1 FL=1